MDVRLAQINIGELETIEGVPNNNLDLVNYNSKVDILSRDCQNWNPTNASSGLKPITTLFIKNSSLPVKIIWDQSAFAGSCESQSLITDWHPGGWFDVGGPVTISPINLSEMEEVEVTTPTWVQYIDAFNDTLSMVFIRIDSEFTNSTSPTLLEEVRVYPNPVQDQLIISGMENDDFQVQIFDQFGQIVGNENTRSIDTQSWNNGIYFLKINAKPYSYIRKILKQD